MDACAEEISPAHQDDQIGFAARAGVTVGVSQSLALSGAHRAVVEVEMQVSDVARLFVDDVAEGALHSCPGGQVQGYLHFRSVDPGAGLRQRSGCGQFEERASRRPALFEVADPDGTVERGTADRTVALRDDLPGCAAKRSLSMGAEQMEITGADPVQHAG